MAVSILLHFILNLRYDGKVKRIFSTFLIVFFLSLLLTQKTLAATEGTISCVDGGRDSITNKLRCTIGLANCPTGSHPPPGGCEGYAEQTDSCPLFLTCLPDGTEPTPAPTATPTPIGNSCGEQGQKCCGTIPPLYCKADFAPDQPYVAAGCICRLAAIPATPTPTQKPFPPPCLEGKDRNGNITKTQSLIVDCTKIDTAFGGIDTDPALFVRKIFSIILSLSGGIALLLIIVSGYNFMMSEGDPEKVKGAKETLTSAIVGLLFIIFSMVLLQVIGVDILKIPGFGR